MSEDGIVFSTGHTCHVPNSTDVGGSLFIRRNYEGHRGDIYHCDECGSFWERGGMCWNRVGIIGSWILRRRLLRGETK